MLGHRPSRLHGRPRPRGRTSCGRRPAGARAARESAITTSDASRPYSSATACRPPGREDVQLEDAIAHDVDGHEGQAVGQQPRPQDVAQARLDGAEVALAAHGRAPPWRRCRRGGGGRVATRSPIRIGSAFSRRRRFSPCSALGEVLLRQRVPLLGHGGDDLVEVGDLAAAQIEDVLTARAAPAA